MPSAADDPSEDDLKARRHVGQLRPRNERQHHGVIQTARAEHDGAAAGETAQHAHAIRDARLQDHVGVDRAAPSDDDHGPARLPAPAEVPGRSGFDGPKQRPFASKLFFRIETGLVDVLVHHGACDGGLSRLCRDDAAGSEGPRRDAARTWTRTSATPAAARTSSGVAPGPPSNRRATGSPRSSRSSRGDVIFTSGATESNNLAILGLAAAAGDRRHIVSTAIEHHAVLEPLEELRRRGFDVTLVPPDQGGAVDADAVLGCASPRHAAGQHDARQQRDRRHPADHRGRRSASTAPRPIFTSTPRRVLPRLGTEFDALRHPRVDLISVSAHKINGPEGRRRPRGPAARRTASAAAAADVRRRAGASACARGRCRCR